MLLTEVNAYTMDTVSNIFKLKKRTLENLVDNQSDTKCRL